MAEPPPHDETTFQALMESVDTHLRETGVPIHAREMEGLAEVSRRLRITQNPTLARRVEPRPGSYSGFDLPSRIVRWFERRYGEHLSSWDPRPGRMVVLIRGDPWAFHFPLLIGQHDVFCSPTKSSDPEGPWLAAERLPRLNLLDSIEDLPEGLRANLKPAECRYLDRAFRLGLPAYLLMRSVQDQTLVHAALADHETTVQHLTGNQRHTGNAKWSALQAAEKMAKAILAAFDLPTPRSHDLKHLLSFLSAPDISLDPELIGQVQTDAGVRYGETKVTVADAVQAHHASLSLSSTLAAALREQLGRSGPFDWSSARPSY